MYLEQSHDLNGYRKWLDYLKTSTQTPGGHNHTHTIEDIIKKNF